jgi:hypothetical protein
MKNPVASICVEAAKAYLITGRSIKSYIEGCKDIKPFITARRVTGGAVWRGEYLGKVVRWVYTTDGEAITYKKNGNKVATSDGATPVMDMPDEIPNLDYNKYITMTEDILKSVGVDYA